MKMMMCIALLAVCSSGHGRQDGERGDADQVSAGEGAIDAKRLPELNGRYARCVPDPISEAEVGRYGQYLSLSEEQMVFVGHLLDDYATKWNALVDEGWAEVDRLNEAAAWYVNHGQCNWSSVGPHEVYFDAETVFREALIGIEEELFAKMEAVLTEPQREWMWRVRADRQRRRANVMTWPIRETWLDISTTIIEELGLTADERSRIDVLLIEYERATSELRERIDDEILGQRKEWYKLLVETSHGPRESGPENMEGRRNASKARVNLLARQVELQMELAMLQGRYLPMILEKLPAAQSEFLRRIHRETVWPATYPDFTDPQEPYEVLLSRGALAAEQKIYLKNEWTRYREHYDQMCETMCKRESQHWEEFARTNGDRDGDEYRSSIKEWTTQRWDLNMQMLRVMKALVAVDDMQSARLIQDKIDHIETYREWGKAGGPPKVRQEVGGR